MDEHKKWRVELTCVAEAIFVGRIHAFTKEEAVVVITGYANNSREFAWRPITDWHTASVKEEEDKK